MGGAGEAAALAAQQRQKQKAADQQWQKVLDANKGGNTGPNGFTTNFEQAGGFYGLKHMIEHADPGAIINVAGHWDSIAKSLNETAAELVTHVNTMLEHWSGASAEAFRTNAGTLHESLTNGAQYASNTHFAMNNAGQALSVAKRDFPGAPSTMDQLGSALGGSSDIQFKQDAAKYGLAQAVKMDGGDLSAWEQVHQQAVVVMESLGTQYNASAAQLVAPPPSRGGVTAWPPPPATPSPVVGGTGPTPGGPGHGGQVGQKPIIGGNGGGHDTFVPGHSTGVGQYPVGGQFHGIHGGQPGGPPIGVGGTLDGGSGGLHGGSGAGGGLHGGPGAGGVGGIGTGSGAGHGGFMGGGGVGMGGLHGGGLGGRGAGFGGGRGRAGGLGRGLDESHGMAGAEGEHGMTAAEKAKLGAAGEGVSGGANGEGGMGMGGGGMGSGSGNKKKRKARADYLVEDEETWDVDGDANPGVITF
ncbi:uncharacterized protein YukE [Streptacidiphilus sp. MAP12-20]|uniref:WXG100 family type VII secretion target n=1 Tax=Streptacidiphilus sp. MAP12-20 TaxID=3156299 RepID=UPI0035135D1C